MNFEQNPAKLTPGSALIHQHDREARAFLIPIFVLTTVSVILRVLARLKTKLSFGADDWFCLASYIFFVGYWVAIELQNGTGGLYMVSITTLTIPSLIKNSKIGYVALPVWLVSILLAKLSILSLYLRLFPTRRFQIAVWAVIALTVAWFITILFFVLFRCTPIQAAWDVRLPQKCANFVVFFEATEPFYMLSTLLIVLIPLFVIKTLQMPLRRKIQLAGVFAFGIFITLISVIRLSITHGNVQKMLGHDALIWSNIQILCSIVIISLPTYGPFLVTIETSLHNLSEFYSTLITRGNRSRDSFEIGQYDTDSSRQQSRTGISHKPEPHSQVRTFVSTKDYDSHETMV